MLRFDDPQSGNNGFSLLFESCILAKRTIKIIIFRKFSGRPIYSFVCLLFNVPRKNDSLISKRRNSGKGLQNRDRPAVITGLTFCSFIKKPPLLVFCLQHAKVAEDQF